MNYCIGSNCKRKDNCQLHQRREGTFQIIDWSTYGSATISFDEEGKNQKFETNYYCGDNGNYKYFVDSRLDN